MRNFEKRIKELGFEVGKISQSVNKEIKEFYQVEKELNDLREELKDAKESDKEAILNEIQEGEEALNDFDEMLVEKVENYAKNKPTYDEVARKMTEGREKKKLAKTESNATPPPTPTLEPIVDTPPPPPLEPIVDTPPTPKVEEESSLMATLGWGALAVLGIFVGIRVFKNK